jgi:hypothetical protein
MDVLIRKVRKSSWLKFITPLLVFTICEREFTRASLHQDSKAIEGRIFPLRRLFRLRLKIYLPDRYCDRPFGLRT